jgi:hypothetical protein
MCWALADLGNQILGLIALYRDEYVASLRERCPVPAHFVCQVLPGPAPRVLRQPWLRRVVLPSAVAVGLVAPALAREAPPTSVSAALLEKASNAPDGETEPDISGTAALPFAPIIARYKRHLFGQGEGRWQALPCTLIAVAQPHYPQIDLTRVRFAHNVRTVHGRAITWHYHMFFPWNVDLTQKGDVFVMLHELEHVVQYEVRGSEEAFLREYIQKALDLARATGNWRVHGDIDLERAAQAKARRVFAKVFSDFDGSGTAPTREERSQSWCRDPG